jgi:hypothetical protein
MGKLTWWAHSIGLCFDFLGCLNAYVSNALLSCSVFIVEGVVFIVEGFHRWSGSHLPNLSTILRLLPTEISRRQGASIEIVFGPF